MTVDIETIPQQDPRLGRNKVHDSASRAFPLRTTVDRSTWRSKRIRIYDPLPNPNQCHGECTGCAKMMQLNAVGNRVKGRVLTMADAHRNYARNTEIDPWEGTFTFDPATGRTGGDDTGSSGLASCKSAQEHGQGGSYFWVFGGADAVVQNIMDGRVVSIGTWWTESMFDLDKDGRIHPAGEYIGGHQYVARGYDAKRDWVLGRCWWGSGYRDFWISREDLHRLLMDGGDAHWQMSA